MDRDEQVIIRLLEEADMPAAMRLKNLARWNQTESDWLRLLKLEPAGCFAACVDDLVVATATTTRYGSELAWIGMVLVDPEFRRRGIASGLMNAALDYLDQAGTRTVKLDATPDGQPVYEALGFERELLIERWEGVATSRREKCRQLDTGASRLLSFDGRAFGAAARGCQRARSRIKTGTLVSTSQAGATGYLMADMGFGLLPRAAVAVDERSEPRC